MPEEKPADPKPHAEPYRTVPDQDALSYLASLGMESMRFMATRLQEDMKLQEDLLKCKSIPELQAVQQKFFSAAIAEYAAESATILAKANPFSAGKPGPAHDKTGV